MGLALCDSTWMIPSYDEGACETTRHMWHVKDAWHGSACENLPIRVCVKSSGYWDNGSFAEQSKLLGAGGL